MYDGKPSPKATQCSSLPARTRAGKASLRLAWSLPPKQSRRSVAWPDKRLARASPSNAPPLRRGHWAGANSNDLPTGVTAKRKRSSISNSIARQRTRSSASRMKRQRFSMDSSRITSLAASQWESQEADEGRAFRSRNCVASINRYTVPIGVFYAKKMMSKKRFIRDLAC
jgi:hypothetical protein